MALLVEVDALSREGDLALAATDCERRSLHFVDVLLKLPLELFLGGIFEGAFQLFVGLAALDKVVEVLLFCHSSAP